MSAGRIRMGLVTILWAVCALHLSRAEAGGKAGRGEEREFVPSPYYRAWAGFPVGSWVQYERTWPGRKAAKAEVWRYLLHSVNERVVVVRRLRYDLKTKQWVRTAGGKNYHVRILKRLLPLRTVLGTETVVIDGRPYEGQKILERLGKQQAVISVLSDRVPGHLIRQVSGGPRERPAIGRTIVAVPKLLIAHEPTGVDFPAVPRGKDEGKGLPVQQPGSATREDK